MKNYRGTLNFRMSVSNRYIFLRPLQKSLQLEFYIYSNYRKDESQYTNAELISQYKKVFYL